MQRQTERYWKEKTENTLNYDNYDDEKIAELCHNVPLDVMRRMAKEIWVTLGIEKHDPRYINEEGILLMALS